MTITALGIITDAKTRRKYMIQRCNASKRGIAWNISYEEWLEVWRASGKWASRGIGPGTYCMSRLGDEGPYSVENVSIIPNLDNSFAGGVKARQVHGCELAGRGWTYDSRCTRRPYRVALGRRYIGAFATAAAAEAAHKEAMRVQA